MGDERGAGAKALGIPAWQLASKSDGQSAPNSSQTQDQTQTQTQTQTTDGKTDGQPTTDLVEQGRRFLQDEKVKSAPQEQKTSFLESKGLSKEEIERAFALAGEPLTVQLSTQTSSPSTSQDIHTRPVPNPSTSSAQADRDVPPIITYPEFLMHAQKPPPIITATRLLNTAYVASAVGTACYLGSKYLVSPMLANLTAARHDFASHAQNKLVELNTKLADAVSTDPKSSSMPRHQAGEADDAASDDSDPTELFHRDFGTQTSPALHVDDRSTDSSSDASDPGKEDVTSKQTTKIEDITVNCKSLMNDDLIVSSEDQETLTVIRVLQEYLESLAYPVYSNVSAYSAVGGSAASGGFGAAKDNKDDELTRFKTEIRSVKGTLLSARNFPSSSGRRAGHVPHMSQEETSTA